MPGTKTSILSLIFSAALFGQVPTYLPLQTGNVWIYRGAAGSFTVEAGVPATFDYKEFFPLRGLPSTPSVWLRNTPEGRIMMWDPAASREKVWLDTAAAESTDVPSAVDPCNPTSRIDSREAMSKGPLGPFINVLAVSYAPGSCADSGLISDHYAPNVGLLQRIQQSIAGPRTYSLVYARVGNAVFSAPETAFSLAVSPDRGSLQARISLRNTHEQPLELAFPSGQQFELVAYDETGRLVYQWSEDKRFIQALTRVSVQGEKIWTAEIPADRLTPGRYAIRVWLPTLDGDVFTASTLVTVPKD